TIGILWLLDVADVVEMGPGRIASAALVVVGVGLLIGSIAGRGRGLIGVGLLLVPVVVFLQVAEPLPVDIFSADGQAVGNNYQTPADESAMQDSYDLGAGDLRLDLRDVEFTEDRDVTVLVGFGEATVLVPDDVTVEVRGAVGAGELEVFGHTNNGVGVERTVLDEVAGSDHTLTIHINVGFGEIRVDRVAASEDPLSTPFDLELEFS
ncbi:MAG: LiaF domain-containing protein, partial [Ilumatobacteraceae bacterium]